MKQPDVKVICCFSVSRTGSNFLSNILRKFEDIDVYSEIFHPNEAFSISSNMVVEFCERYSIATDKPLDSKNSDFIYFCRSNPVMIVSFLCEIAARKGRKAIYFKVFNEHVINQPDIIKLVSTFDCYSWILQRKNIDSFISFKKAMQHNVWESRNNTDFKVELDLTSYLNWSEPRRYWYQFLVNNLPNDKVRHITYEEDIDIGQQNCVERFQGLISKVFGGASLKNEIRNNLLRKQDLSRREEKVTNYKGFVESLKNCGRLDEALGYFIK
ncbi:hypothetical protein GCM10009409_16020 [Shewanella saliphila]|uniref:Sulfotransferase domain-containing protein n=2 Tax=Shewanella saliphila TaxID=2282698 RepID=A0ABQ2Q4N0_9GAMM|nr:hypothetical protein GCM10009409_16020 [Shewanella saliphila]